MLYPAYQSRVAEFVHTQQLETSVEARLLDLSSEVGELAKEVLKANHYGRAVFAPSAAWVGELADVFFVVVCLANSTQVNLDEALNGALEKYRARSTANGEVGSGE